MGVLFLQIVLDVLAFSCRWCQYARHGVPLRRRYHELQKQAHGIYRYMPLYTEIQLVAIGDDMARQEILPEELRGLYTEEEIRRRFQEFGWNFRSVLRTLVGTLLPRPDCAFIIFPQQCSRAPPEYRRIA